MFHSIFKIPFSFIQTTDYSSCAPSFSPLPLCQLFSCIYLSISLQPLCQIGRGDVASTLSVLLPLISWVSDSYWQRVIGEYEKKSWKHQVGTTSHKSHPVVLFLKGLQRQTLEWALKVWTSQRKNRYTAPSRICCSLFNHVTGRACIVDTPWSDPSFDSSRFIVILIIINHLNMLAKLTL